jgi:hypothetical protein
MEIDQNGLRARHPTLHPTQSAVESNHGCLMTAISSLATAISISESEDSKFETPEGNLL